MSAINIPAIKVPPAQDHLSALLLGLMTFCTLQLTSHGGSEAYAQSATEGLSGAYYPERSFGGVPVLRIDPQVNFNWGNDAPFESDFPRDSFQVRWRGWLVPQETGWHTLSTRSDDGVRLFADGLTLVNQWRNQGPTTYYGTPIWLDAGSAIPVTLEYYESGGGALMEFNWRTPSEPEGPVPSAALRSWESGQDIERGVQVSFTRPFLWEGSSTNQVSVTVARPHGDVSEEVSVELLWEGEGANRLSNKRGSVTISAQETSSSFALTLIDDLHEQGTQEVSVSVVGSDAPAATLELWDNDGEAQVEVPVVTGEVRGLLSADVAVVRATPIVQEVVGSGEPVWREGEPVEERVSAGRYALGLPEGRYRVTAHLERGEEHISLALTQEVLTSLPESVLLIEGPLGEALGVEQRLPPSLYALDFEVKRDEEPEAGAEAGAEVNVEAGAEVNVEAGAEVNVEAGAEVNMEAGAEVNMEAGAEVTREPTVERPSQVATSCEATPQPHSPLVLLLMWLIHLAMNTSLKRLS